MDADLYAAATTGDIECILKLREKKDQVTEDKGETILHLAAVLSGKPECVVAILDEFPSLLDKVNSRNETALHLAAREGYEDVVVKLIQKAGGLGDEDEISPEGINFLRKGNVDLDTALHLAVRNYHYAVVRVISTADPCNEHPQNLKFETPLYLAVIAGHTQSMCAIMNNCKNASVDGPEGRTVLHAAVTNGDHFLVAEILKYRGDLKGRVDSKGWTAFHYVASLKNSARALPCLTNLIDYGERVDSSVLTLITHDSRQTAHHIAAYEGRIDVLMQLIHHYPNVCEISDKKYRNILHIAAMRSHKEMIQYMLEVFPHIMGNLLNEKDEDGNTPLHLLVLAGCYVPELIKHEGVDRDITNDSGYTPQQLLYLDDNIVKEQVMIKYAFEEIQTSYWRKVVMKWWPIKQLNLWITKAKSNRRRRQASEHSSEEIKRRRKDAKFKLEFKNIMNEEIQLNKGRTNTQIIVTALIATVTFTVGFTMPGGNHDGDTGDAGNGLAILSKKVAFNVCMVADAVGLLFSTSSLFLYFISSLYQDPREVSKFIAISTGFNIVSVVTMMLTFITGTYVVLFHSPGLAIVVSVISCMFFLLVILLLIKLKLDPSEKFKV